MVTYFTYGPTLLRYIYWLLYSKFYDAVSEAVITNTKLDLYVNNYSHSKTLWFTLFIYLKVNFIFMTLWATQWSQKLSNELTLLLLLYYKTMNSLALCWRFSMYSQVLKALANFWRLLARHGMVIEDSDNYNWDHFNYFKGLFPHFFCNM